MFVFFLRNIFWLQFTSHFWAYLFNTSSNIKYFGGVVPDKLGKLQVRAYDVMNRLWRSLPLWSLPLWIDYDGAYPCGAYNVPSYVLAYINAPKCAFMQEVNTMRLLCRGAYNDVIITMRLTVIGPNCRAPNLHAPKDHPTNIFPSNKAIFNKT